MAMLNNQMVYRYCINDKDSQWDGMDDQKPEKPCFDPCNLPHEGKLSWPMYWLVFVYAGMGI